MKIEAQDQGVEYKREMATVQRLGFFFPVAVPALSILLSMKLTALLSRQKGRDFYDTLFLWQRVEPNYDFLYGRCGIANKEELMTALQQMVAEIDLQQKKRDFEHLLFEPRKSEMIVQFWNIIAEK